MSITFNCLLPPRVSHYCKTLDQLELQREFSSEGNTEISSKRARCHWQSRRWGRSWSSWPSPRGFGGCSKAPHCVDLMHDSWLHRRIRHLQFVDHFHGHHGTVVRQGPHLVHCRRLFLAPTSEATSVSGIHALLTSFF